MAVEGSERDPEKTCNTEGCNAWATKESDRSRCRNCGGESTGPKTPGNQNAQTHGLYSVPEYLKQHFSEEQEDRYTAYFEALCSRYTRMHGHEPDEFAKDRLSRVAIECVKERIADEWLSEKAQETGNLLIENYVIDTDESGEPVSVETANNILGELTALKRETRLTLKDMGLLESPEKQAADAEKELGEVVRQALND